MRLIISFVISLVLAPSAFGAAATRGGFLCGSKDERRTLVREAGGAVGVYSIRKESFLRLQMRRAGFISANPDDFRLVAMNDAGLIVNSCVPSKASYPPLPAELQDRLASLASEVELGAVKPCDDLIDECISNGKGVLYQRITNDGSGQKAAK